MRRPLALALVLALAGLSTACAHRAAAPDAVAQARAAQASALQASAHERRHEAITMLESMLGVAPMPTPTAGSPGH